MRLAPFILENIEPILAEWEVFARSTLPGAKLDRLTLRDHAQDILRATARDMVSAQSDTQRSDKSKGEGETGSTSTHLTGASAMHALERVESGFDLEEVVSEYRALRASVICLWRASEPHPDLRDIDDLTRFHEAIDQSLTDAVRSYTQRVDRSRQMFLAILGHDLRNPLNSIAMSAEYLQRLARPGDDLAETATQISSSTTAIARMVGDLLDYTNAGLGSRMPVLPAEMDMRRLCQEVVDECRAAHPHATLRFDAEGDATGFWDAARMRQVVSNLLGNAIQHGQENGEVQITLRAQGPDIVITFHNHGTPIPPELHATIFDPLVRGQSPSKPRRPGSIGLGLYIAREVAAAHGGTIDVQSSAQAGTRFIVRLPRRPA